MDHAQDSGGGATDDQEDDDDGRSSVTLRGACSLAMMPVSCILLDCKSNLL